MRTQYLKKITYIVITSIILTVACHFLKIELFDIPENLTEFHFNLITINSIVAGFSFTAIGILISVADSEVVQKISRTDYMSKKNERLLNSIVFSCVSIFISLFNIIGMDRFILSIIPSNKEHSTEISLFVERLLYISCILFLMVGIVYFLKSIQEVSRLLGKIYENKSSLTEEKIKDIHQALRKKGNSNE